MSAFIVSKNHIDYLVSFASIKKVYNPTSGKPVKYNENEAGQMLVDQNHKSYNARYKGDFEIPAYSYSHPSTTGGHHVAQVLKACDCYEYQACETPDYYTTPAAFLIHAIRKEAGRMLPGYDDAAWEIR